jgi:hypothetical protein
VHAGAWWCRDEQGDEGRSFLCVWVQGDAGKRREVQGGAGWLREELQMQGGAVRCSEVQRGSGKSRVGVLEVFR